MPFTDVVTFDKSNVSVKGINAPSALTKVSANQDSGQPQKIAVSRSWLDAYCIHNLEAAIGFI
jgi:hypothetical protein